MGKSSHRVLNCRRREDDHSLSYYLVFTSSEPAASLVGPDRYLRPTKPIRVLPLSVRLLVALRWPKGVTSSSFETHRLRSAQLDCNRILYILYSPGPRPNQIVSKIPFDVYRYSSGISHQPPPFSILRNAVHLLIIVRRNRLRSLWINPSRRIETKLRLQVRVFITTLSRLLRLHSQIGYAKRLVGLLERFCTL